MKRVVVIALAVVALVGCTPADAAVPKLIAPYQGSGTRKVALFGDSLSVMSRSEYEAVTHPGFKTSYNAQSGTTMRNWVGGVWTAGIQNPHATVFALGTNDSLDPSTITEWNQAYNYTANDCRVFVIPYSPNEPRQSFTAELTALAYSRGARVYDWHSQVVAHPEWLLSDNVHYNAAGVTAYAAALNAAQAMC